MISKVRRWISRNGWIVAAIVGVLILIVGVGQIFHLWDGVWRALFGTAGPVGGYSCLPTCDERDGKFLSMPGEQMNSFGGEKIVVWISVPSDWNSFTLGFFDGDSGKDNSGAINLYAGHWDGTTTESTYTLYADPLKDGRGTQQVAQWMGNTMPNNAWYDVTLNVGPEAKGPSGHYFYRLECTRPVQGSGINALKLRSTAFLSTGQADLVNANFAIVGMLATWGDLTVLYPQFQSIYNPGPSTYTGDWQFYLYIPNETKVIEIWDGDFDRGTFANVAQDTDDPNTEGKPAWASPFAVPERAGGQGNPPDDLPWNWLYRRTPPVWYEVINPAGSPIYTNSEPSGTEEWEHYIISTDPAILADTTTDVLQAGLYRWHIVGLDVHNTVWIRTNYELLPPPNCPDCSPDIPPSPWCTNCRCPRTIGYWKNNVKKVLIEGKTRGVQETRETLEWALRNVALASPLFRSGINVHAPVPIAAANRLTDQEAHAILQKEAGNTMLDRALQQNLAAWLNLGSGKLGPNTVVDLNWGTGSFQGTVWEALQEAQNIILYRQNDEAALERAKNIADLINNGELGYEGEDKACEQYAAVIPPHKQPPDHDKMPRNPKQPEPPNPQVGCTDPRVNQYGVENPTNNPFYGIKFEYQSGTEIKDGLTDEFRFTLPADQAAAMTSIQLEAKAGQNEGQATLQGCAFNSLVPCETTVQDPSGFFTFSFQGAVDNRDGTLTLIFYVTNWTGNGLSHATFGLPAGVVPSWPAGNYQSQMCP